jgi:hypothetical protein
MEYRNGAFTIYLLMLDIGGVECSTRNFEAIANGLSLYTQNLSEENNAHHFVSTPATTSPTECVVACFGDDRKRWNLHHRELSFGL